jgi:lipid II:glycine glycyltransferase (peptidoglycan interpeptide bridge formation enzyme)
MKNNSSHPMQSLEWGIFREKTGIKIIKTNSFQLTIHKIPHTKWTIGYLPKGDLPNKQSIEQLKKIGKEEKCIFIQLEPKVELIPNTKYQILNTSLVPAAHPLFTRFNFELDLTKSEEELLKNMHPKTRYNNRIAEKHEVKIIEDNSEKAFLEYLKLTKETTQRQGFFAHTQSYHRIMWETLKMANGKWQMADSDKLTAHLFLAKYNNHVLTAWILFVYKDTLYYPYGASSSEHREVMASNLMMWEAIKYGKKLGLKKFDMWGALGQNPNQKDPWYGFHRFKQGYGPRLVEYIGSFDLVINPILYKLYVIADKIRWTFLRKKVV